MDGGGRVPNRGFAPLPSSSRLAGTGQTLGTVTNDPRNEPKGWWGWPQRTDHSWADPPPPLDPHRYPQYTRRDLDSYLRTVRGAHTHFLTDRASLTEAHNRQLLLEGIDPISSDGPASAPNQGDGLAKALLQVPAQFFKEDFSVEGSGLLQGAETQAELADRIDELSGYLDVVETQLMREVAMRSRSVFDAAGGVSVLHQQVCGALGGVRHLRGHLTRLDETTYATACRVVALTARRRNLATTVEVLQVVEEVANSRSALQLLLDGQDYAGALDLLEVVVHNMEANTELGLHAFAQAVPQMRETRELLESLLACEFVSLAHFSQASSVMDAAISHVSAIATQAPSGGLDITSPASSASLNPAWGSPSCGEDASAEREVLHDKLLPIVLALLRVDKLTGALQQLCENCAAATKALVQEVLERMLVGSGGVPHLQAQLQDSGFGMALTPPQLMYPGLAGAQPAGTGMGGGHGMALPSSAAPSYQSHPQHSSRAESGAGQSGASAGGGAAYGYTSNGASAASAASAYPYPTASGNAPLPGGLQGAGDPRAAGPAKGPAQGPGEAGSAGPQPGYGGPSAGHAPGRGDPADLLAALGGLQHDGFLQVMSVVAAVVEAGLAHHTQIQSILRDDILPAATTTPSQVSSVMRSAQAVTQVLAEVAAGRWTKLMVSRSAAVPRLKLYEFQALADACDDFATLLEAHSGRAASSIRAALQAQCRTYLEALHIRNVAQLQQLLEVEQWTATEVAPTFQDIVDRLVSAVTPPTPGQGPAPLSSGSHARSHSGVASQMLGRRQQRHRAKPAAAAADASADPRSRVPPTYPTSSGEQLMGQPPHGAAPPQSHPSSGTGSSQGPSAASAVAAGTGGLLLHGKRFPLVNTTLMLLKLLDEYMGLADTSPLFGVEIGHHVCDLIKVFNAQACQLVLGAGAVRTAGLKSISAKHLAVSCESCYLLARLVPHLRAIFMLMGTPLGIAGGAAGLAGGPSAMEPRRHMLLLEFDKVMQDLTLHTNEIHSKLVDIMQDRLVAAARQLTTEAASWGMPAADRRISSSSSQGQQGSKPGGAAAANGSTHPALAGPLGLGVFTRLSAGHAAQPHAAPAQPPAPAASGAAAASGVVGLQGQGAGAAAPDALPPGFEASPAMRSLAKQLGTLQSVLVPILQQEEVQYIFGRVCSLYSEALAATLDALPAPASSPAVTAAWEDARRHNTLFALQALKELPLEPTQASAYTSRLATFYTKHYGHLARTPSMPALAVEPLLPPAAPPAQVPPALPRHPTAAHAAPGPLEPQQPQHTGGVPLPPPLEPQGAAGLQGGSVSSRTQQEEDGAEAGEEEQEEEAGGKAPTLPASSQGWGSPGSGSPGPLQAPAQAQVIPAVRGVNSSTTSQQGPAAATRIEALASSPPSVDLTECLDGSATAATACAPTMPSQAVERGIPSSPPSLVPEVAAAASTSDTPLAALDLQPAASAHEAPDTDEQRDIDDDGTAVQHPMQVMLQPELVQAVQPEQEPPQQPRHQADVQQRPSGQADPLSALHVSPLQDGCGAATAAHEAGQLPTLSPHAALQPLQPWDTHGSSQAGGELPEVLQGMPASASEDSVPVPGEPPQPQQAPSDSQAADGQASGGSILLPDTGCPSPHGLHPAQVAPSLAADAVVPQTPPTLQHPATSSSTSSTSSTSSSSSSSSSGRSSSTALAEASPVPFCPSPLQQGAASGRDDAAAAQAHYVARSRRVTEQSPQSSGLLQALPGYDDVLGVEDDNHSVTVPPAWLPEGSGPGSSVSQPAAPTQRGAVTDWQSDGGGLSGDIRWQSQAVVNSRAAAVLAAPPCAGMHQRGSSMLLQQDVDELGMEAIDLSDSPLFSAASPRRPVAVQSVRP